MILVALLGSFLSVAGLAWIQLSLEWKSVSIGYVSALFVSLVRIYVDFSDELAALFGHSGLVREGKAFLADRAEQKSGQERDCCTALQHGRGFVRCLSECLRGPFAVGTAI